MKESQLQQCVADLLEDRTAGAASIRAVVLLDGAAEQDVVSRVS